METMKDKCILVTGGTGSFGQAFVKAVLEQAPGIRRLVIFSRDELKQSEMARYFDAARFPGVRYFIGDVRDASRLRRAMEGIDFVIHAAALKQVPIAEYNPLEFIQTNVLGTQNIIEAALDRGIKKVIALSTDKAAAPINLYGATKLCADKLLIAANNIRGTRELSFSVVRYGNVLGSRGSVIPFFLERRKTGMLPITDEAMTRFNINLEDAVRMVLWALSNAKGGEILVPKLPSYRVTDVATAIGPECEQRLVGIRPGEKIHEELITESDSYNCVDRGSYYVILPHSENYSAEEYCEEFNASPVRRGFSYNSGSNPDFLTVEQLRELINRYIECSGTAT